MEDLVCSNQTIDKQPTAVQFVIEYGNHASLVIYFICFLILILFINYSKKMEKDREPFAFSPDLPLPPIPKPRTLKPKLQKPKVSKSCSPIMLRSEPSKAIEHLSAEDLQVLAGADEFVEQESATDYCYGGYKPIKVGEELVERYAVIRKLGYGHFSTVWLCRDIKTSAESQYVAIKIVKSAEMFNCVAQDEIKLLRSIKSADPNHAGYKHIIQMLDYFQVMSINGYHTCISFELMGPSLLHLLIQSDYCGIHLPGVQNILIQVLKGMVYLHKICKIIHTDIKPENILIKVKDQYIRNLVETSTRYTELGVQMPRTYVSAEAWENYVYCRPLQEFNDNQETEPTIPRPRARSIRNESIKNEDGIQEKTQRSPVMRGPMYISSNIEVKIADLGNACWDDHHFATNIQTKQYRALEVILDAGYSFPADIWSVGCLAFELATGEYLFNPRRTSNISSTEDHILLICELLGGIPKYIAQKGNNSNRFFDSEGTLSCFNTSQLRIWKTEDVLVDKYKWKRVDAIPFAALIDAMIEPDPELRLTAENALSSEWLIMKP
ncbi:serine/threonine-protein kinase SRPK-like [Onthophagus taurus]|uniref:serine/threonine-protein kinase SRPK-like n=1 Tax=Onthophagus taurus TaxID=166361 RepID=UPI0039BEA327